MEVFLMSAVRDFYQDVNQYAASSGENGQSCLTLHHFLAKIPIQYFKEYQSEPNSKGNEFELKFNQKAKAKFTILIAGENLKFDVCFSVDKVVKGRLSSGKIEFESGVYITKGPLKKKLKGVEEVSDESFKLTVGNHSKTIKNEEFDDLVLNWKEA